MLFIASFFICLPGYADALTAKQWLEQMRHSITSKNYDLSFVVISENKANPWHWLHGKHEGQELEILTSLNGPIQQIVRKGDVVTYIDKQRSVYSVKDSMTDSPMPDIIRADLKKIEQSYTFTLVGKSRVAGYKTQLIRVIPKDSSRYAFWLWLHVDTALPLKTAIVNKKGDVLEQIQVASFHLLEDVPVALLDLKQAQLPIASKVGASTDIAEFDWQVNWVPNGFSPTRINRHRLYASQQEVDYLMLSDGLVWFSVYIRKIGDSEQLLDPNTYLHSGADTYLTQKVGPFEVTVIGEIPPATAKRLAQSVTIKTNFSR
ncbi:MucB/RseB C-terminal domain-containing protein [Catenovulum sp. SM1970]|uniref:MucB/RseB C-terminal domain-containing protein n=1 Tax=Marinifaba aquimaris TaxID=2741323 RepID=UPI0015728787|nr:MucB/RseB C-terminal domain-containing protein [Marinifaba aquimaris]NTS76426.1 MucB/RseB C-terminal domain-containing protein [Marinifaba aquimaris]